MMKMNDITESLTFTIPLSGEAHKIAQRYSKNQFTLEKAEQVYHNILAVQAVKSFLKCMGLETNWTESDSFDLVMQTFSDVADLEVNNYGKFECRPVLQDADFCYVPPDVWSDRIGYIIASLNESLDKATIIGFARTVAEKKGMLPLCELQPLDELPEYLSQVQQTKYESKLREIGDVDLGKWWQNIFAPDWLSLEEFINKESRDLPPNFRAVPNFRDDIEESPLKRVKLIDLGMQFKRQSLAMMIGLKPEADNKIGIRVQLRPPVGETHLPPNLKLTLVSASGETVQEVKSGDFDNFIQLKRWKSKPGTKFKLQVVLNDLSLTGNFFV